MIKFLVYGLFIILLFLTVFAVILVNSNALIPYADDSKISLREDSVRYRRSTYFYSPDRTRTPSGGGFGFGK